MSMLLHLPFHCFASLPGWGCWRRACPHGCQTPSYPVTAAPADAGWAQISCLEAVFITVCRNWLTQETNVSSRQRVLTDKIPQAYLLAYGCLCLIQLNIPQNSENICRNSFSSHIWFTYLSHKPYLSPYICLIFQVRVFLWQRGCHWHGRAQRHS